MKAVGLYEYLSVDDERCFIDVEVDKPKATGRQLLVEIKAVSVNPVDTKVRKPKDKIEERPRVLGWDASGVVVAVGEECVLFKPGDEVYYAGDLTKAGSNAQYQTVDERIVGRKPTNLSHEETAALPLTTLTAWEGLFDRLAIQPDSPEENRERSLLIIAGAGGVGSIATQIAKKVAGIGTVITTASRRESQAWCSEMGSDYSIDHSIPLLPQIREKGLQGVDYILCCAPTELYFDQMVELIRPQGSICTIVETTGGVPLPMNKLQGKSVRFCWEFMFTRSMHNTDDIQNQHEILNRVCEELEAGHLVSTMTRNLGPLTASRLIEAHRILEQGQTVGKVVLSGIEG